MLEICAGLNSGFVTKAVARETFVPLKRCLKISTLISAGSCEKVASGRLLYGMLSVAIFEIFVRLLIVNFGYDSFVAL